MRPIAACQRKPFESGKIVDVELLDHVAGKIPGHVRSLCRIRFGRSCSAALANIVCEIGSKNRRLDDCRLISQQGAGVVDDSAAVVGQRRHPAGGQVRKRQIAHIPQDQFPLGCCIAA